MAMLVAGLLLFFAVHLFPSLRSRRQRVMDRVGPNRYKIVFSVLSIIGLALIVRGYSSADYSEIWASPSWGRSLSPFFMLPACYAFVASGTASNLKRFTRSPLAWAVLLWALIHLLNNGDLASVLLFGSFALYAVFNMWSTRQRPEPELVAIAGRREAMLMCISVLVYITLLIFHPALFGVAVFQA
jgi:uncharacterized membrane protein